MASDGRALSSAAPIFTATISEPEPVRPPPPSDTNSTRSGEELSRTRSLKRPRPDSSYNGATLSSLANAGLVGHPQSPKSPRFKGSPPRFYAAPLTGAAAMEDERRKHEAQMRQSRATSENPGHRVMSSLMAGGGVEMSRPSEAPNAATSLSEGLSTAANSIYIPGTTQSNDKSPISPLSASSVGGFGNSSAQTAIAGSPMVASPGTMTSAEPESQSQSYKQNHLQPHQEEQPSNRAFSFPGNILTQNDRGPSRGMSLPVPGQQLAPRSPSQKKHKCPYCETEFTRHHNLKSHLLTHSQEKPYVCQTCTMRFRRLHDLKRHMKLHTGERPHVCPKCNRKFARGDALARHSKGQGGCAGRRSSIGGFDGDEDYDGSNAGDGEEGMDGVVYTADPNEMTEEDRRRLSLPSIKAHHAGSSSSNDNIAHSRQPSSYPPIGPRPGQSSNNLFPPARDRAGSGSSSHQPAIPSNLGTSQAYSQTSNAPAPAQNSGRSVYSQGGLIESPKPLSPSAMQSHQLGNESSSLTRQRSPSLTTQFQQQQFGRRPSAQNSPPVSLPSPHTSKGPRLPALSNLAPPDQRFPLQGQNQQAPHVAGLQMGANTATSPSTMFQPPMGARLPSTVQHPISQNNDNNNLFAKGDSGVLSYVSELEAQVKQLNEKVQMMEERDKRQEQQISRLNGEVYSLRNQLAGQQHQQQHYPLPLPPGSMT